MTPRRWDIAVKWRYFRHLLTASDPDSERVYTWHIAQRRESNRAVGVGMDANKAMNDIYAPQARELFHSMLATGFDLRCAIPVGVDGELLGGAHRLACALALDIEYVPVRRMQGTVWAPAWGEGWFCDRLREGVLSPDELDRVRADFDHLHQGGLERG